jgi:outer membrane protein OmpA-like peptidoglycan-associated protein
MAAADVGQRGRIETSRLTAEQVRQDFGPALDAQPPEPISFVLYFEEGSTEVLPGSRDTLDRLFDEVSSRQAVEVQITGHTDTVGKTEDNDRLSAERAEAIKQMLMEKGLQAGLIRAVGRGERQLLIPTEDNAAEPKNRRVEVIVR